MIIHGKKITTIVSDLDGTLLGNLAGMDEAVFPLISRLREKGVRFVAASGRQCKNMQIMFAPMIKGMPLISENGSMVVKDDRTLYVENIPKKLAFELIGDMLQREGTDTIVSCEKELYTLSGSQAFLEEMEDIFNPKAKTVEKYQDIPGDFNKVSIRWKNGIPKNEEKWFHEKYDACLQVMDGGNGWLDFTMQGVNKGAALRKLAEAEGFSLAETLCFGDSENDIAMFHECGISYAMATGREHVKAAADYVCDDVKKMLAEFLEQDEE